MPPIKKPSASDKMLSTSYPPAPKMDHVTIVTCSESVRKISESHEKIIFFKLTFNTLARLRPHTGFSHYFKFQRASKVIVQFFSHKSLVLACQWRVLMRVLFNIDASPFFSLRAWSINEMMALYHRIYHI